MKISVKATDGNQFDMQVAEDELVSSVKAKIEESQGKDTFPCAHQRLVFHEEDLKDETTMADNDVSEGEFLYVMFTEMNGAPAGLPASSSGPVEAPPPTPAPSPALEPAPAPPRPASPSPALEPTPAPPRPASPAPLGGNVRMMWDSDLTPEERASIERWLALELFDTEVVIEAFLACDRDERQTVEYLNYLYNYLQMNH